MIKDLFVRRINMRVIKVNKSINNGNVIGIEFG